MRKRAAVVLTMMGALAAPSAQAQEAVAVFAGGCFWSVEAHLESIPGVVSAVSGFAGGTVADPTYPQVIAGGTGHLEAVEVRYDPSKLSYEQLLNAYWHSIDPTDPSGQFCDKGPQYHTAIFYRTDEERALAQSSRDAVARALKADVATQIRPAATFYPAEDYHQDFARTNPQRYRAYSIGCGRDDALRAVWGDQAFAGLPGH